MLPSQELSADELKVAMEFLDEDGSGAIEFNEFVGFWSGIRRVPGRPGDDDASTWDAVLAAQPLARDDPAASD